MLPFVRLGGRGGDEGLARTRGGYLHKTRHNRGKNEVRPGAWPLGFSTTILLETMSGKGSEVGRDFGEIRAIIDAAEPRLPKGVRLGVCLDTCHVWDGGYDIVGDLDGVIAEFDRVVGLDRLKAVHANDSMNVRGAHKDRHEKIGKGKIGLEAFSCIVNHPKLRDLPFYLETPCDLQGYKEEIALLKSL